MNWQDAVRNLQQLKADIPKITGNEMVNFALDNIRTETDIHGKRMKPRKANARRNSGRGLLVDTGAGRRSIRIARSNQDFTELTANEYMQAHNEGVNRTVTSRSRRGKTFSRRMNLPKRQFTGKSDKQTARIERVIANRVIAALT